MVRRIISCSVLSLLMIFVASCAGSQNSSSPESVDTFESYNRAMFKLNYRLDKYVMKPVAQGYRKITNKFVRERVNSALANIREPLSAGNFLLQGNPKASGKSVSRFVLNSTLGLGGMFDVAEGWGLQREVTTFNETFAKWCIKDGPFIVLPFLGPSTPRAATGMFLGFVLDPVYWASKNDANYHDKVTYGYAGITAIAMRESSLELLDDLERNSVDFYATMRSAYLQNQSKLRCFNDTSSDNTYDFDFGVEEEDKAFDEMEAN